MSAVEKCTVLFTVLEVEFGVTGFRDVGRFTGLKRFTRVGFILVSSFGCTACRD